MVWGKMLYPYIKSNNLCRIRILAKLNEPMLRSFVIKGNIQIV